MNQTKRREGGHYRAKSSSSQDSGNKEGSFGRRGGYGDGGGVTDDGSLPKAQPIRTKTEQELNSQLNRTLSLLDPKKDWNIRVSALVTLEGLVLGGACQSQAFKNHHRQLREVLVLQIIDRRSAVSRQACRFIETMVQEMGAKFDGFAYAFFPEICKVLVITIQVMAEAADSCLRTIFNACHSVKLVPKLCEAVSGDKNAKIRQYCARYLQQVVTQWDPKIYEKYVDVVEKALKASMGDALSETRGTGRTTFVAYSQVYPERAMLLYNKLDGPTKEKLASQDHSYQPLENQHTNSVFKVPAPRGVGIGFHGNGERPSTAPSGGSRNTLQKPGIEKRISNRSKENRPFNAQTAVNQSHNSVQEMQVDLESLYSNEEWDGSSSSSQTAGALNKLLTQIDQHQWSELVSRLGSIEQYLATTERMTLQLELHKYGRKLVKFLLDGIEHNHFKVVQGALQAMCTLIDLEPKLCEPNLPNFYGQLFLKAIDAREQIRTAATMTYEKCGQSYEADVIIQVMAKTLGNLKVPKAQSILLKYFVQLVEVNQLIIDVHINHAVLRQLVKAVMKTAMNKNADVRDAAVLAIQAIYQNLGQKIVLETLQQMGENVQTIVGCLKTQISGIETDYSKFLRMKSRGQQWHQESVQNHHQEQDSMPDQQHSNHRQSLFATGTSTYQEAVSQENQNPNLNTVQCMDIDEDENAIETHMALYRCMQNDKTQSKEAQERSLKMLSQKLLQQPTLDELLMLGSYVNEVQSKEIGELMMQALITLVDNQDTQLQDNAILTLKSLAPYQPTLIDQFAEELVLKLIQRCENSTRLVSMSADTTLSQLVQVLSKHKFMGILLQQLVSENVEPQYQVHIIENVGRVASAMQKDELFNIMQQQLIPLLLKSLDSQYVGVRKAVVCCLVDIWEVVGQDLFRFLQGLTPAQQNLIKVYINKKANGNQIVT